MNFVMQCLPSVTPENDVLILGKAIAQTNPWLLADLPALYLTSLATLAMNSV